jgi:DNA-binding Lrp family transcriptional regulator
MTLAFVLINVEIGSEETALKAVREIDGVVEAFRVYGVYDTIVKVNADNLDELKEIITYRIRRVNSVRSTLTLVVM